MNIQIFGKNKCFDTKKAQRWFKERGIKFQMIDLAQKGMSKGELDSVLKAVGGLDNLLDQKSKSYASLAYLAYDEDKKEKLLEDVDGTAIQFYHFDSKTIKVCNDFEIDAVYVDSEIELGCVLYE